MEIIADHKKVPIIYADKSTKLNPCHMLRPNICHHDSCKGNEIRGSRQSSTMNSQFISQKVCSKSIFNQLLGANILKVACGEVHHNFDWRLKLASSETLQIRVATIKTKIYEVFISEEISNMNILLEVTASKYIREFSKNDFCYLQ